MADVLQRLQALELRPIAAPAAAPAAPVPGGEDVVQALGARDVVQALEQIAEVLKRVNRPPFQRTQVWDGACPSLPQG